MLRIMPVVLSVSMLGVAACGGSDKMMNPPPSGWTLENLAPAQGYSLRIDEFDVPAGAEVQDCYFVKVPDVNNGQDVFISRIKMAQNPGSHHMNVFRVKSIIKLDPAMGDAIKMGGRDATVVRGGPPPAGECWKSGNWADWPIIGNTQSSTPENPYVDWKLPDGVATRFSPGEMLMVQTHYVNATTQKTPNKGAVGINFYKYTGPNPPQELGTFFATQQSIRICQGNQMPEYAGACRFPNGSNVKIVAANGHFHSRGTKFDMYTWDGMSDTKPADSARFYRSTRWDDPPMVTDLSIAPPAGGGVYWTCDYKWSAPATGCDPVNARDKEHANDCCYTFGPIVETSEHCNVFVYYYPKVQDIFCN